MRSKTWQQIRVFLLLLLLLLPQQGLAGEALFLTPQQVDVTRLLPPPPALGSPEQQQDLAQLLTLQKERTPEQVALAKADEDRSVFRFADVVGKDFTPERLPLAAALFAKLNKEAGLIVRQAKKHWDRPRPFATSDAIHPCLFKPMGPSYPSTHSTFGTLTGIILANMIPEKAREIYARAALYRFNREIGGVHYPSDVAAGRIVGTVIAAFLFQDKAFMDEYAKARAETRQALGLTP
jgi:acid phosphatase (class A)